MVIVAPSCPGSHSTAVSAVSGTCVQQSSRGNNTVQQGRVAAVVVPPPPVRVAERNCDTKLRTVASIHFLCSGLVSGLANHFPVLRLRCIAAVFCVLNDGTIPTTSSTTGGGSGSCEPGRKPVGQPAGVRVCVPLAGARGGVGEGRTELGGAEDSVGGVTSHRPSCLAATLRRSPSRRRAAPVSRVSRRGHSAASTSNPTRRWGWRGSFRTAPAPAVDLIGM